MLSFDARLEKGSGCNVYLVEKNFKRWITNPDTFNSYGFDWAKIKTVEDAIINSYVLGPEIK